MELLMGVLALTWAGLAMADAVANRFGASHITGFLLVPAGAVLLWLAGTALVRSRKPGRLRYVRRAAWVALALLAVYWVVLPVGMAAYATHRPQTRVPSLAAGVEYQVVTVHTADGVRLQGWYVPSQNGAATGCCYST